MGSAAARRSTADEVIGITDGGGRPVPSKAMIGESTRTRARLWLRAAGLAGRRGGQPLAPPAGEVGEASPAVTVPAPRPRREESRLLRFCLLGLLTILTTTLWFAVLLQKETAPSYMTDEAAIRTMAHMRIAQAARVAREEGDVVTADWLDALP
jgi:hypothetical protein